MGKLGVGVVVLAAGLALVLVGAAGAVSNSDASAPVPLGPGAPATGEPSAAPSVVPSAAPSVSPSAPPTPVVETPEAFLPVFVQAIRDADAAFLLDRLHPAVIAFYGRGQCRVFVGGFEDPGASLRFVSTSPPGEFSWEVDGFVTSVPDVLTVTVIEGQGQQEQEREIHLGIVGSELHWFADCGEPA